ncbi:hypothetical protein FQZ46_25925, partial [Escherichia coli]|nr:hypothetical protein [Escherichia coli]
MVDSNKTEEALVYIDRQIEAVKASGSEYLEALLATRADILVALHRYDEAREVIDELAKENDYWGRDRINYHLKKLYIMALCGQDDEVWEELP